MKVKLLCFSRILKHITFENNQYFVVKHVCKEINLESETKILPFSAD